MYLFLEYGDMVYLIKMNPKLYYKGFKIFRYNYSFVQIVPNAP